MSSNSRYLVLFKSFIALALPPALLIASLALSIVSAYSSQWAEASLFDPIDGGAGVWPNRTTYRGVFWECSVVPADNSDSDPYAAPSNSCHRFTLNNGSCKYEYNSTSGLRDVASVGFNQHLCQQLDLSSRLLVAGVVLVGVSMIFALVIAVVSWSPYTMATKGVYSSVTQSDGIKDEDTTLGTQTSTSYIEEPTEKKGFIARAWIPLLTQPTRIMMVLGTIALVLTQFLAVNALVNDASPNGDYLSAGGIVSGKSSTNNGSWYMGHVTLTLMPAAWLLSGVGAWISIWSWY